MFNQIIVGRSFPQHLSFDHDPLFRFHRWRANLRILEVEEIKSIPYVPVSHPFVERLIGTIRREFLDHVLIWNAVDLGRKLESSEIITTNIAFTSHSMAVLRENDLANRRRPMLCLPTTLGGTIVAVCSRCQSRRNLRIRHGQAASARSALLFVIQIEIALAIVMIADIDGELAMLVIVVAPDTD